MLGNKGLLVSKLCFGTMTFGDGSKVREARPIKSVDPRRIGCEFLRANPAFRPGVQQVERKHAAV
jgi:hypothetical protein